MILLDTHVLVWYLAGRPVLPPQIEEQIENAHQVFISAASIWELGIKARIKGKEVLFHGHPIDSRDTLLQLIAECEKEGIQILEVSADACTIAPFLPGQHKDPFDRIIAAQSLVPYKLTLISADTAFDSFGPEITRSWPRPSALPSKKRPKRTT